jgi:hypothetical protein
MLVIGEVDRSGEYKGLGPGQIKKSVLSGMGVLKITKTMERSSE